MTEQHPSFGGVAVADPRATTSPLDLGNETESADNRRKLALVGAVVAVVVVLIAAFFLLKGKGAGDTGAVVPPHVVPPTSTGQAGTTAAAAAPKPIKLPKPFAGVVGRDPFKPLFVPPVAKTSGTTTTTTTGPASNPVPSTPVVSIPTTGGTTTQPSSTNGGSTTVGANFVPVWIQLVRATGTKSATFIVGYSDGKHSKTVTYSGISAPTSNARTVFAKMFSLLSIQNGAATVQVGDGTPFDLSKGSNNRHYLG